MSLWYNRYIMNAKLIRKNIQAFSFAVSTILILITISSGATLHVPSEFLKIQEALDSAQENDIVLVAHGEYVIDESLDFNKLHDPDDADSPAVKNIQLKSEAGPEKTIIRLSDTPASELRKSIFIFENGENNDSVLEGFTITGGEGYWYYCSPPDSCKYGYGGGIYLNNASPVIRNCIITENGSIKSTDIGSIEGVLSGGGLYCRDCVSAVLENCTISRNVEGGIRIYGTSSMIIENCIVKENTILNRKDEGGGIFCRGLSTAPLINNCVIKGNTEGAIYSHEFSTPKISNCRIEGNLGGRWFPWVSGGITSRDMSRPIVRNCTIIGNRSGIKCIYGSLMEMTNCVIAGNYFFQLLLRDDDSCASLTNCTITGGSFSYSGPRYQGGVYHEHPAPPPVLKNCIVWRMMEGYLDAELDHCLTGENPCFTEPGVFEEKYIMKTLGGEEYLFPDFIVREPDLSLTHISPAIDAGTMEDAPETDIEGFGRPCGDAVDIGAYEYGSCEPLPHFLRGDANTDGRLNIADAVTILTYTFGDKPVLPCMDAADANDDGDINIADAATLLYYLFSSGEPLPDPFDACGRDLTKDSLGCADFPACEQP